MLLHRAGYSLVSLFLKITSIQKRHGYKLVEHIGFSKAFATYDGERYRSPHIAFLFDKQLIRLGKSYMKY